MSATRGSAPGLALGAALIFTTASARAQTAGASPSEPAPSGTTPAAGASVSTSGAATEAGGTAAVDVTVASPAPPPPPTSAPPPPPAPPPPARTASPPVGLRAAPPPRTQTPPPADDPRLLDVIFLQAEGGAAYTDLTALSSEGRLLPELTEFRGWGYGGGLTVGFRYALLAVAAHGAISRFDGEGGNRASVGTTDATTPVPAGFDLGQLMAEVQLRIPVPVVEPYARVGFGYAWMGSFQVNEMYRESTSSVHGWTGKLGMGLDLWLGRFVTIGGGVDLSLLNLRRGGVQRADSACPSTMPTCVELSRDGDAVGLLALVHAQVGLHF